MKTPQNLYPHITSFVNLLLASRKAQRGKRYRHDVLAFNSNLENELFRLQKELESFQYSPQPYRKFQIFEPKRRVISAAAYRDRVVHHALCAVIVPPLERAFLPTSYANRQGFGSHRALRHFVSCTSRYRWVFQADLRLYFPSIDHQLLMEQLKHTIHCPATIWLLQKILENGAEVAPALDAFAGDDLLTPLQRPRGLPIGNLTSQFLANFHLNDFDHHIASLGGIREYLRYVDDFALFADHPAPLERARLVVARELRRLWLRLHPIKSQIRRTSDGVSFVGFHVVPGRVRVRNHTLRRGRSRLRQMERAVERGDLGAEEARQRLESWNAHLAHGHTWRLRRQSFAPIPFASGLP